MSHVVTAAYVTVRVKNNLGQDVLHGFYEGAVLPDDVNQSDLDRHVRKGMVAEAGTPEADAASPVGRPVEFDDGGMPLSEQARRERAAAAPKPAAQQTPSPDGQPGKNDSREKWADYARSKGAPDAELAPSNEGGLTRDALRDKYGA